MNKLILTFVASVCLILALWGTYYVLAWLDKKAYTFDRYRHGQWSMPHLVGARFAQIGIAAAWLTLLAWPWINE